MLQVLAKEWMGAAVELGFRKRRGLDAAETANTPQAIIGCGADWTYTRMAGRRPFCNMMVAVHAESCQTLSRGYICLASSRLAMMDSR